MTEIQFQSPLKWPQHIVETERLKRAVNPQFSAQMSEGEAIAYLQEEINHTPEISSAQLSCNAVNINSPQPTQYIGRNPGVALTLRVNHKLFSLCCDRWLSIAHNIYALHLAIRHFRQVQEWGVGNIDILLHGFSHEQSVNVAPNTQQSDNDGQDWRCILGLGPTATLDDANAIYRARAMKIGEGKPDELQSLNLAIQQARQELN